MRNKKQCIQDTEGQKHEGMEEMEESCSCSTLLHDGDTCPICLNCLLEQEIGFPENCSHAFCMTCILKWAEVRLRSKVCVVCVCCFSFIKLCCVQQL
uniref:RING-type domain-containing protein n=1 Tax=Meleagris gallopavo TaxID=9103 RepID=A0A803YM53_MELGA